MPVCLSIIWHKSLIIIWVTTRANFVETIHPIHCSFFYNFSPKLDILTHVSMLYYITLHYITLHYRHFKLHLHLKWPVVHQQLHVIRNTAHRPSKQASYTASRVRPKRKISCAAAQIAATQIAATLTISYPRWRHMSLTSYWGQQRMSLTSYLGHITHDNNF